MQAHHLREISQIKMNKKNLEQRSEISNFEYFHMMLLSFFPLLFYIFLLKVILALSGGLRTTQTDQNPDLLISIILFLEPSSLTSWMGTYIGHIYL